MADPGLPQIDNHRRSNQKDCPKLPNYQGESHPRSRGGETWDQSVSYRQNLGTGSPALLGYRNEQYPSTSTPQQRPSWEGEKLPARNLPNQRRSDIDITRKHPEQDQIKQTLAHPSKLHVHRYPANSGSPAALTSKMRSYKDTRPPDVTMLMDAVKSSNTQDIRRILDKGVDVNSKELGYTAMHLACQLGHIDTIEYLLFCGADISIRDQNGQTPGFYSKLKGVSVEDIKAKIHSKKRSKQTNMEWMNNVKSIHGESGLGASLTDMYQYQKLPLGLNSAPGYHSSDHLSHPSKLYEQRPAVSQYHMPMTKHSQSHTDLNSVAAHKSSYDNFPSPFEYLPRTPQSGSLDVLRDFQKPLTSLEPTPHSSALGHHMNGSKSRHDRSKLHSPANFQTQREVSPMPNQARPSPFKGAIGQQKYEFGQSNISLEYQLQAPESKSPFLINERSKSARFPPPNTLSSSFGLTASHINSPFRTNFYKLSNVQPDGRFTDPTNPLKLSASPFAYYPPNMYPNGDITYPMFYPSIIPPGLVPSYPNPSDILPHRQDTLAQHALYKPDRAHLPMPGQSHYHPDRNLVNTSTPHSIGNDHASNYKNGWSRDPLRGTENPEARKHHGPPSTIINPVEDRRRPENHSDISTKDAHKILGPGAKLSDPKRTISDTDMRPYLEPPHNKPQNKIPQHKIHDNPIATDAGPYTENANANQPSMPRINHQSNAEELQKQISPHQQDDKKEGNLTSPKSDKKEKREKGRKRKLETTSSFNTSSSGRTNSTETTHHNLSRNASNEPGTPRREKRPRKSETEDEYLYGWAYEDFSSTEPENDDSSDEDFFCESKKKLLIKKSKDVGLASSRPMRQSSLRAASLLTERREGSASDSDGAVRKRKNRISGSGSEKSDKKVKDRKAKSRKLSSESASSFNCLEETNTIVSPPRKLDSSASSSKSKESKLKKKLKKLRRNKLAEMNKSKVENSLAKKKRKKKNSGKSDSSESPTKKAKKDKHKEKVDPGNEEKKNKSPKKLKPQLEADVKNKKLTSPKSTVSRRKSSDSKSKIPSGISKSLIELYIGSANNEQKISPIKESSKNPDNLFGTELTESEAAIFGDVFVAATKELDKKAAVSNVLPDPTTKTPQASDLSPHGPQTESQDQHLQQEVKVRKKPGRKPKFPKENATSTPLKSPKKHGFNTDSPKSHIKYLKHLKKDMTSSPLLKSGRKGRPPGSSTQKQKEKQKSLENQHKPVLPNPPASTVEHEMTLPTKSYKIPCSPKPRELSNHHDEVLTSSVLSTPSCGRKSSLLAKSSRPSTPLSSKDRKYLYQSPLPPNLKKLTCNSAIGETVLHKAARHGYTKNMQHYLESGFAVNSKDNAGYTALHEACVHGKLDAAILLLQFGADVNLNSLDGTRPIHDAIEYDHLEMTRLLLSCGADPLLSKFSGRSIRNMIHSNQMDKFVNAYLKELQPLKEETLEDDSLKWKIPFSAVLEPQRQQGYNVVDNPPTEDPASHCMDFELFNETPIDTYLVQPSDTVNRSNYHVLQDILQMKGCSKADFLLEHCANIRTMPANKFCVEAASNWVKKRNMMSTEPGALVELVSADKQMSASITLRVHSDGQIEEIPQVPKPKSCRLPPPVAANNGVRFLPKPEHTPSCSYTTPTAHITSCSSPKKMEESVNEQEQSLACLQKLTASFCTSDKPGQDSVYSDICHVNGLHKISPQPSPIKAKRKSLENATAIKTAAKGENPVNPDFGHFVSKSFFEHSLNNKPYKPSLKMIPPQQDHINKLSPKPNGVGFSPYNKLGAFNESQTPSSNLVSEI